MGTTTYAYDTLARLTGATSSQSWNNFSQSYAYDLLGNITNKSDVGTYTYANTGFANPDAATAINGVTYAYDNSGNLIQYGNTTNVWSYRDRLTNTNDGNSTTATTTAYRNDENDQRVAQDTKNGAGGTTTTTYFSNLFEKAGGTTTLYVYAGAQLVATIEGNGVSTSTYVTHTDHLNSSAVQSDKNGNVAQLTQYYPYGGMIQNAQPSNGFNEHRKYIGQTYDDATAQSYLNARYYDGGKGKFISQDPILIGAPAVELLTNPKILNLYSYSTNNPITKSDPTGLLVSDYQPYLPSVGGYSSGDFLGNYRGSTIQSRGPTTNSANSLYQCPAFVQSFIPKQFNGATLGGLGDAVNYGNQSIVNSRFNPGSNNNGSSFTVYKNGGSNMPQENDVISWSGGASGHVGVIVEVNFNSKTGSGYVYTAEQNFGYQQGLFAQPLTANTDAKGNTTYSVGNRSSSDQVQAWTRYGNQSTVPTYTSTPATPAPKTPLAQPPK